MKNKKTFFQIFELLKGILFKNSPKFLLNYQQKCLFLPQKNLKNILNFFELFSFFFFWVFFLPPSSLFFFCLSGSLLPPPFLPFSSSSPFPLINPHTMSGWFRSIVQWGTGDKPAESSSNSPSPSPSSSSSTPSPSPSSSSRTQKPSSSSSSTSPSTETRNSISSLSTSVPEDYIIRIMEDVNSLWTSYSTLKPDSEKTERLRVLLELYLHVLTKV